MGMNFYKNKVCLNVLVNSIENAKQVYDAAEGNVVVGLLSKNYKNTEEAVIDIQKYMEVTDGSVSIGLGAGDPNQSKMVAEISAAVKPPHINQVFTGVGFTRGMIGEHNAIINSLVSPCGKQGFVNIATGAASSKGPEAIIKIEAALNLMKDMGANAIKYFPMGGLKTKDEYTEVANACAKHNFILEPTGGIDLENFENILKIALNANVPKIIPHVYTSIIDKTTGSTNVDDVRTLFSIIKTCVG